MDDINLKSILEQFPDCITNGTKLKAVLLDMYSGISKAVVNTFVDIVDSGIAKEILSCGQITNFELSRWQVKIENDFGLSEKYIKLGLDCWIKAIEDLRYKEFHIKKERLFKYTGLSKVVIIPEKIKYIWNEAFKNCEAIKSVVIPEGVKYIGDYAFENCHNLENISLPQSLKKIGYNAFWNCSKLKTTLLGSIMYVGNRNNPYLVALKSKQKTLIQCSLPKSTKIIYSNAFMDCIKLKKIKLPQLHSIGISAFAGCEELEMVSAEKCDEINEYAFSYCKKLKNISIGGIITYIRKYAFERCDSIDELNFSRPLMWDDDVFGENSSNKSKIDICYDYYFPFYYRYNEDFRLAYERYIKHDIFADCSDLSYYDIEDEQDLLQDYGQLSYSYFTKEQLKNL